MAARQSASAVGCATRRPRDAHGEWQAFNAPRPLYRGELLNKKPSADVVIVEGEKAADALASKLPDHVVLSWAGGCKAINQSDWAVLEGRNVSIWADNDEPGRTAAKQLQGITEGNLIDAPSDKPEGWDAADAVAEGWTTEGLQELLTTSVERQTFNVNFGNEGDQDHWRKPRQGGQM